MLKTESHCCMCHAPPTNPEYRIDSVMGRRLTGTITIMQFVHCEKTSCRENLQKMGKMAMKDAELGTKGFASPVMLNGSSVPNWSFVVPCDHCGQHSAKTKRCGRCRTARYCGEDCQRLAWAKHKKSCHAPQNDS